jgi:hypothetical protein
MGYGFYFVDSAPYGSTRPAGYGVVATCDKRGCAAEIDRGLGYLCGTEPHGPLDESPGCGRYFCADHLGWVGPRGGCSHRQSRPYGLTLACMAARLTFDPDHPEWTQGATYCLFRVDHEGPHAFERDGLVG